MTMNDNDANMNKLADLLSKFPPEEREQVILTLLGVTKGVELALAIRDNRESA